MIRLAKVYHKKNHQKRGIKICEIPNGLTVKEQIDEINKHTDKLNNGLLRIWKNESNDTVIDYGYHNVLLVVKERN